MPFVISLLGPVEIWWTRAKVELCSNSTELAELLILSQVTKKELNLFGAKHFRILRKLLLGYQSQYGKCRNGIPLRSALQAGFWLPWSSKHIS